VLYDGFSFRSLKDWQVLLLLNELASSAKLAAESEANRSIPALAGQEGILIKGESVMREFLPSLDLPYRQPELELLGIIAGIAPTMLSASSTS
jgi:hypothetical protein